VSKALDELITKEVPGVIVPGDRNPAVPAIAFAVNKIIEFAVTAVVLIVIEPAVIAPEIPVEPAAPVARVTFVVLTPALKVARPFPPIGPVIFVPPVALPIFTAPVPPVPIAVAAAPVVLMFVVPVNVVGPVTVNAVRDSPPPTIEYQRPAPVVSEMTGGLTLLSCHLVPGF